MTFDFEDYIENDIGLGEEDLKSVRKGPEIEWYKSEKGRTDRVSLIYFHPVDVVAVLDARKANKNITKEEMASIATKAREARAKELGKSVDQLTKVDLLDTSRVQFKSFQAHYVQGPGMGYFLSRLGKDGAEADSVWKKIEPPKQYITTLMLIYPTDRNGNVDKGRLARKEWKIQPWRFGPGRYKEIHDLNTGLVENDLSIASQDLKLECTETQFQQIKPSIAGKALWRRMAAEHPKVAEEILTQAVEFYDKLIPFREMSTEDLRIKLGMAPSSSSDDDDVTDFGDMLDQV